ncbi:MAG: CIA30 family protein [Planctomycetota bacterium]
MWTFISTSALLSGGLASVIMASGGLRGADNTAEENAAIAPTGGTMTEPLTLAEFEGDDPKADATSGTWQTVNDDVMGGRSLGGGEIRGGRLVFSGTLNTAGGGFVSVRAADKRWDLGGYDGIAARVRGDARTYQLRVRTDQRVSGRVVSYGGDFRVNESEASGRDATAWREIFVPFSSFEPSWRGQDLRGVAEPLDPSDVRELGVIVADGENGPFYLEIDWLRATIDPDVPRPELTLATFDGDNSTIDPISGNWRTVNDNIMGGRSQGGGTFENGALIFAGSTNTNGGGFSSVRAGDKQWDLSAFDGLAARVRADGRTYVFHAQTDLTDDRGTVFYRGEFTTEQLIDTTGAAASGDDSWQTVCVPFEAFDPFVRGQNLRGQIAGLDPSSVRSIGVMIDDGLDGPFRLEADWVKAVRVEDASDETI